MQVAVLNMYNVALGAQTGQAFNRRMTDNPRGGLLDRFVHCVVFCTVLLGY